MKEVQIVGVIGAGVMGAGVAQVAAANNLNVILVDVSQQKLEAARNEIINNLRLQTLLSPNRNLQSSQQIIERVHLTTSYDELRTVDYIVENVTEDWSIKRQVYQQLDQFCQPHCVFAANTSAIPITRISASTKRPSQVLGIHFMNPVPLKNTVEIIKGVHTSAETIESSQKFLQKIQKDYVLVNDSPGFVSNRVLMLTINEAVFLIHEGVASAEDIDKLFMKCFEHKMGPLATADMIGLDTILQSIEVLYESFNDSKYRPCPLLKQMVDAGFLGRKSGKGFYEYQGVKHAR